MILFFQGLDVVPIRPLDRMMFQQATDDRNINMLLGQPSRERMPEQVRIQMTTDNLIQRR